MGENDKKELFAVRSVSFVGFTLSEEALQFNNCEWKFRSLMLSCYIFNDVAVLIDRPRDESGRLYEGLLGVITNNRIHRSKATHLFFVCASPERLNSEGY